MTSGWPYTAPSSPARQATDRCPAAAALLAAPVLAALLPNCPHAAAG